MQLYSSPIQQDTSFKVSPYFFRLLETNDNFYKIEVSFSVLQSKIFSSSLSKVTINVVNPNVSISEGENTQRSANNSSSESAIINADAGAYQIQNLLKKSSNQIILAKQKLQTIIASSTINLQAYINQDVISSLKANKKLNEISSLYSFSESLEEDKDDVDFSFVGITQKEIKKLNHELLSKFLIDPSDVVRKEISSSNRIINDIRAFYLNDALSSLNKENVYYKSVKKSKLKDELFIKQSINVPKTLTQNSLKIAFEIYDTNNETPIHRVFKGVDLLSYQKLSKLAENSSKIFYLNNQLNVIQDKNHTSFTIKLKEFTNSGIATEYRDAAQTSPGPINVNEPSNKLAIYRCIFQDYSSDSNSVTNPYFKNVVVGKPLNVDSTGLVIEATPKSNSSTLRVVNPPFYADQVQIERREKVSGGFSDFITIVKFSDLKTSTSTYTDMTVRDGRTYEYRLKYKTSYGSIKESVSQIYKHINSSLFSVVSTVIESPEIGTFSDKPEVRFTVSTTINPDSTKKIKDYFDAAGYGTSFFNEIASQAENLQNLIFNKISRVNLKTGVREVFENPEVNKFGLTDLSFVDNLRTQKEFSISSIDPSTNYMYEIRTFLRNPLSMLRDHVKTVEASPVGRSGKTRTYSYRPYKWRQPLSLDNGTILHEDESGNITSHSILDDGEIGVTATYIYVGEKKSLEVKNLYADRLDLDKIKISWKVENDLSNYDHFVLIKEVNRKRTFLNPVSTLELIDKLQNEDRGTIIYYVMPVLRDYSLVEASRTNAIVIDPKEF